MALAFALTVCHIDSDMLHSGEGRSDETWWGSGPRIAECPACRVILPSSGYCEQCERFVALA